MSVYATHLSIATVDRAVLCSSPEVLLEAVRAIARVGRERLMLSCVVDDHAHAVVALDRNAAGLLARGLARTLGTLSDAELAPARFRQVEGRSHLVSLVAYVLRQPSHHGLQHSGPVALWPGSCFVDLVGARLIEGFEPRTLARALPRLGRDKLYEAVGMRPVQPMDDDELRAEGPRRIGDAAAAAVGVARLERSGALVVRARRAAGRLCRGLGFPDEQLAFGLRCPEGTASRLTRGAPPDPTLDRAIRLQLALRREAAASLLTLPNQEAAK